MKPITETQSRNFVLLLLAGTLGLVLLMHFTASNRECCSVNTSDIHLLKLI